MLSEEFSWMNFWILPYQKDQCCHLSKRKIKKIMGGHTVFNTFAKNSEGKNNNDRITQTLPVSLTQHHQRYFSLFYTWVIIISFGKKRLKRNMLLFLLNAQISNTSLLFKWETLPGLLLIWKTSQIFWCRWNWVSEGGRKSLLLHVRELSSNGLVSPLFLIMWKWRK